MRYLSVSSPCPQRVLVNTYKLINVSQSHKLIIRETYTNFLCRPHCTAGERTFQFFFKDSGISVTTILFKFQSQHLTIHLVNAIVAVYLFSLSPIPVFINCGIRAIDVVYKGSFLS